ncbi:hypothetical protein HRbin41_00617 [bacterium HR41]|nr:hypothetical protein HRbin41_00617 [bacterium HR41]
MAKDLGTDRLRSLVPAAGTRTVAPERCQTHTALGGDPTHHFRRHEVPLGAAHLPDTAIRFPPAREGRLDHRHEPRPHVWREVLAPPHMQVNGVDERSPHVVLALAVGAVADPYRPRAAVAAQVRELALRQLALSSQPVQHLDITVLEDVAEEVEEVVSLAVEAEAVQRPQCERCVAHPAVAVVPVARTADRRRQRRRSRGGKRTRRLVGECAQGQRRALQHRTPRMVREAAAVEPFLPEVGGLDERAVGVVVAARKPTVPGQSDEPPLPCTQCAASARPSVFDADPQVAGQPQARTRPAIRGIGGELVVATRPEPPPRRLAPVVEARLAGKLDLDLAVHAVQGSQQHAPRRNVGGCSPPFTLERPLGAPAADEQRVAHHKPSAAGSPARFEHHRAGQVAAIDGHRDVGRTEPEEPCVRVKNRPEHARRVEARQTEPFDGAVGSYKGTGFAVGEERVFGDRHRSAASGRHDVAWPAHPCVPPPLAMSVTTTTSPPCSAHSLASIAAGWA